MAVHGLRPETLRPASADASFRRYLRLDTASGASLVVMDAPPDKENCRPFVQVQALMQQAGLRVPEIVAWDEAHGFMLLSDLGAQTVIEVLNPENPPGRAGLVPAGGGCAAGLAAGLAPWRAAAL